VEVGVENLILVKQIVLLRLGLLDLYYHVAGIENLFPVGDDLGTSGLVLGVIEACIDSALRFDPDSVSRGHVGPHVTGGQTNPILVALDLFDASDLHRLPPWLLGDFFQIPTTFVVRQEKLTEFVINRYSSTDCKGLHGVIGKACRPVI